MLEIRLLGGFEVRRGARILRGFESQKVRALLIYLCCHNHQSLDRSHLSALLWPDEDLNAARQNLRQAVYNLRKSLRAGADGEAELLLTTQQSLQINPECNHFLDVEAFEHAARLGLKSGIEADVNRLSEASEHYRGHLLPAFSIKGSDDFDDWLWEKREQLRELAVRNLRVLIGCHLESGEYALGIDHGRALVELDPLSEEAHRTLIHLYFLAGRRSQALMQYESFAKRLETELHLSPLSETTALYESILSDTLPGPPTARRRDPIGPFVSMEGRDRELRKLMTTWREVLDGHSRLLMVDGESGVGKSRLVKTFLHQATSETRSTVLRGRSYTLGPARVYGPIIDLLRNAWRVGRAEDRQRFNQIPVAQLNLVRVILPEITELGILESIDTLDEIDDREGLFDAISAFLLAAAGAPIGGSPNPLILFIDDVQWTDTASLEYLVHLLESSPSSPLLVVMTNRPEDVGPDQVETMLHLRRLNATRELTVERISKAAIERMVASLLEPGDRRGVAALLVERSKGLPLVVTETINYLCDLGHLKAKAKNRWHLTGTLDEIKRDIPRAVSELIARRIGRLPSSTRRLLTHASLTGHRFDFHLLRRAADEHVLVVETAIGLMLEHWLARQFPDAWASTHRERDIVLWAQGARRGTFEFVHKEIRQAAHQLVPEDRRAQLHLAVAEAIEQTADESLDEQSEELAYHYEHAGAPEQTALHLQAAARRAARLRADLSAHRYCVEALDLALRLEAAARTKTDKARWKSFGRQIEHLRNQVGDRLGPDMLQNHPSVAIQMD